MPTRLRVMAYYRNTGVYLGMLLLLPMNWVLGALGLTLALILVLPALAWLADACFSKPLLRMAWRGTGVQGIPGTDP